MQLEFDPRVISFEELSDLFWRGHDPHRAGHGSQYRAILVCETDEQLAATRERIARLEDLDSGRVETQVERDKPFWPAEDYHQKWKLRQTSEVFADLLRNYESEAELLRSAAANKLNALVAGALSAEQTARFEGQFGLSTAGLAALRGVAGGAGGRRLWA